MTAFRALASRAAETEETYDVCIAHLATLDANVEGKLSADFGVGNEVINDDDSQSVEVEDLVVDDRFLFLQIMEKVQLLDLQ